LAVVVGKGTDADDDLLAGSEANGCGGEEAASRCELIETNGGVGIMADDDD